MPNFVVFIIKIFKKWRLLIMVPIAIGTGSSPGEGAKATRSVENLKALQKCRAFFMTNFVVFIIKIFKKWRLLIMVPIAIGTGSSPGEGAKATGLVEN